MFHHKNHYRVWKLIEKSMKKPSEREFLYLLRRFEASLQQADDTMRMLYYITLHGTEKHLEAALPLLAPETFKDHHQTDIAVFLKALAISLWYIPSLAVEKVSSAHRYFLKTEFAPLAA